MKLVVLTSETPHHVYFLREITRRFPVAAVLSELRGVAAPFETHHPYEDLEEKYEWDAWFAGRAESLSDYAATHEVETINRPEARQLLERERPDVVLVFGTRKIGHKLLSLCPKATLNLHRGDPERYRGLDSHQWAIYHRDFRALETTLHVVNEELDDGAIVGRAPIALEAGTEMHELRRLGSETGTALAIAALEEFQREGAVTSRRQQAEGRYYSFMPACLKQVCVSHLAEADFARP